MSHMVDCIKEVNTVVQIPTTTVRWRLVGEGGFLTYHVFANTVGRKPLFTTIFLNQSTKIMARDIA